MPQWQLPTQARPLTLGTRSPAPSTPGQGPLSKVLGLGARWEC